MEYDLVNELISEFSRKSINRKIFFDSLSLPKSKDDLLIIDRFQFLQIFDENLRLILIYFYLHNLNKSFRKRRALLTVNKYNENLISFDNILKVHSFFLFYLIRVYLREIKLKENPNNQNFDSFEGMDYVETENFEYILKLLRSFESDYTSLKGLEKKLVGYNLDPIAEPNSYENVIRTEIYKKNRQFMQRFRSRNHFDFAILKNSRAISLKLVNVQKRGTNDFKENNSIYVGFTLQGQETIKNQSLKHYPDIYWNHHSKKISRGAKSSPDIYLLSSREVKREISKIFN